MTMRTKRTRTDLCDPMEVSTCKGKEWLRNWANVPISCVESGKWSGACRMELEGFTLIRAGYSAELISPLSHALALASDETSGR